MSKDKDEEYSDEAFKAFILAHLSRMRNHMLKTMDAIIFRLKAASDKGDWTEVESILAEAERINGTYRHLCKVIRDAEAL